MTSNDEHEQLWIFISSSIMYANTVSVHVHPCAGTHSAKYKASESCHKNI